MGTRLCGLPAANLTVTVGFGPGLFDERFGLASTVPPPSRAARAARRCPRPDRSGGDLCVQACANDPQVAFHVIRNFARLARGTAVMRWSQLGFGRTSSTSTAQATPRNLMGFKDGTRNIKAESAAGDGSVRVGRRRDRPALDARRQLPRRAAHPDADRVVGHRLPRRPGEGVRPGKTSGAPLTGTHEFDTPNLTAKGKDGAPVIDLNAHIRLAAPASNGGQMILRRGYSYTDGIDQRTGLLDAGLFFIAYQKDPHKQFVPIQQRLGQHDLLNEYIRHTGSAVFAVPPGLARAGGLLRQAVVRLTRLLRR